MKKRIAVFANGWSDEFVQKIMNGVQQCMREQAMDVYVFAFYSASAKHEFLEDNPGEENIFRLPDLGRHMAFSPGTMEAVLAHSLA